MKKLLFASFLLIVGVTFSLSSCGNRIGGVVEGKSYTTEGWIDGNTYRIAAVGVPNRKMRNVVVRKASAKRAAILNAQHQVLEKFKGAKIEAAAGMSNYENTGTAVSSEVQGMIKGGSVRKVTYDKDQNAEIIYEVKARGLKKRVTTIVE